MTKHPTTDWEWEDTAEVAFQEWFNDDSWMEICGGFSFRSEYFFDDCEVGDVKTRQDLMYKWLHSAFLTGYNTGRCSPKIFPKTDLMTDTQKLEFLLKELKSTAKQKTCYDNVSVTGYYHYSDDHDATFDDGDRYGKITFARELLESMGESYE